MKCLLLILSKKLIEFIFFVTEAVHKTLAISKKSCTDEEINLFLGRCFRYSVDRAGGRKKRDKSLNQTQEKNGDSSSDSETENHGDRSEIPSKNSETSTGDSSSSLTSSTIT